MGLGELFVFIFFGLVATVGTVYVQELRVTPLAILAGCGIGFLATAILILNNLRDIETDAAAGKFTLATRIGRRPTLGLLLVLVGAAFAVPVVILVWRLAGVTIMAMLFGIPFAAVPVRTAVGTSSAPALVGALKRMAATELVYALLMAFGLLLS
jgi:1,4-dihydroxy-2-naphthoate octaprenyltransferase